MSSPAPLSLNGLLLLADPRLRGSTFERSVILVTEHGTSDGTHGLVLNRPTEETTLGDLLPSLEFKPLADVPVYQGGPVTPNELALVALRWNGETGKIDFRTPLGIAGAMKARREGWEVRAFTGYTGWSGGQLERELEESSWIVMPPVPIAMQGVEGPPLWSTILRAVDDPLMALLAELPDDPTLN